MNQSDNKTLSPYFTYHYLSQSTISFPSCQLFTLSEKLHCSMGELRAIHNEKAANTNG